MEKEIEKIRNSTNVDSLINLYNDLYGKERVFRAYHYDSNDKYDVVFWVDERGLPFASTLAEELGYDVFSKVSRDFADRKGEVVRLVKKYLDEE